ncbi:MAG: hypothetical protein CSA49_07330 [Gammaproteobacteria bacterium]|nr:MAG: hypothetical protein CSA49_07330 [Gammaproteobacteria bacterium]
MIKIFQGALIALLASQMAGCNQPESTKPTAQQTKQSAQQQTEQQQPKWLQAEATIKSVAQVSEGMYAYTLSYPATGSKAVNAAGEPIAGPIVHNVFGLTYLPKAGQTLTIEYLAEEPLMYRMVQPWGSADPTTPVAGVYTYGHEVESFTPCNVKKDYWITSQKTVLDPLRDASLAKAKQLKSPYQGIYAEMQLMLLPAAADGFAADYDGVVEAFEIKKWTNDIPETCITAGPDSEPPTTMTDEHSSRNSLDWDGYYYGAIPCASCPQIDRWLQLKQKGESTQAELFDIYRGTDELVSELTASARWIKDGGAIAITVDTGTPLQFIVGESALMQYAEGEAPLEDYKLGKMLHYSDRNMDVFTDRSHLLGLQGSSKFEAIVNYKTPNQTANSARIQVTVDCGKKTYTTAEVTGYTGRFASGSIVKTANDKTAQPLTGDTALAAAALEACH